MTHIIEGAPITPEAVDHVDQCALCWLEYRETVQRWRLRQIVSGWDLGVTR